MLENLLRISRNQATNNKHRKFELIITTTPPFIFVYLFLFKNVQIGWRFIGGTSTTITFNNNWTMKFIPYNDKRRKVYSVIIIVIYFLEYNDLDTIILFANLFFKCTNLIHNLLFLKEKEVPCQFMFVSPCKRSLMRTPTQKLREQVNLAQTLDSSTRVSPASRTFSNFSKSSKFNPWRSSPLICLLSKVMELIPENIRRGDPISNW